MNIVAFTCVHYGLDYLASTLRSTQGFAERHVVLYTPVPTYGVYTDLPNPDNRDDLFRLAQEVAGDRLDWIEDVPITASSVMARYSDADAVLELDADEILTPDLAHHITSMVRAGSLTKQMYRLPMVHHWRSFNYICRDTNWPIRLYMPQNRPTEAHYYPDGHGVLHHFGYARTIEDTRYKMAVSMHIGEFRPGWWEDIFLRFPERLDDLHPVCLDGFWKAEAFDRYALPEFMRKHPYFDREVIE